MVLSDFHVAWEAISSSNNGSPSMFIGVVWVSTSVVCWVSVMGPLLIKGSSLSKKA
jgi:hypothetical protein